MDFKAAFDSIDRQDISEMLRFCVGIPERIVQFIEGMYVENENVVVGNNISASFDVNTASKKVPYSHRSH